MRFDAKKQTRQDPMLRLFLKIVLPLRREKIPSYYVDAVSADPGFLERGGRILPTRTGFGHEAFRSS